MVILYITKGLNLNKVQLLINLVRLSENLGSFIEYYEFCDEKYFNNIISECKNYLKLRFEIEDTCVPLTYDSFFDEMDCMIEGISNELLNNDFTIHFDKKYGFNYDLNFFIDEYINKEINKFRNISSIEVSEANNCFEIILYDFLDKPGNFKDDIDSLIKIFNDVLKPCKIDKKFYTDEYWDGENIIESYLYCNLSIKF